MYAAIRRCEGVDRARMAEMRRINDGFLPIISGMSGYHGCWVLDAGDVLATFSLFETEEEAADSRRAAAEFIRERNLQDALPNAPQVTAGDVTVAGSVHALT